MADRIALSCIVATLAFWAYTRTLVPGVDLGDTGGFQAAVLWPAVSARQAYPLYYTLAKPFVAFTAPDNPARALNLFSAVWAAAAAGLLTWLCASITRSRLGGAMAGLLIAFSYTFWTQAIVAEVYSLHLALVALCLLALQGYATTPTRGRLAVFFAVYALSFGNHLSMILLLVPFAVFLVQTTPARRDLVHPGVVLAAGAAAAAGALQYWPNLMAVWGAIDAPEPWAERLASFWFDVTKADWRESMVLGVRADQAGDRLAMWWFDVRQQFGTAGAALAGAGVLALWRLSRPWTVLVATSYAVCTAFALTYNVGDTHVFFLNGHFLTALCAGAAVAWTTAQVSPQAQEDRPVGLSNPAPRPWRRATVGGVALAAVLYGGWRGWTTWPAVDRHDDRRGQQLIARLARGVSEREAILVAQMNWQLENVLLYMARHERPDLAWVRLGDVLPHFPFLVEDNQQISRDVVMTADAAAEVAAAYGPRFPLVEDPDVPIPALIDIAAHIPAGAPYVLSVLTPPRDEHLDSDMLTLALRALTGAQPPARTASAYEVVAGLAGEPPVVYRSSDRPFEIRFRLGDEPFTVRMDSWLPTDTFRRAGFGHVLRGRDHILILERGINLVWLGRDRRPSPPVYAASLFAPKPRFRIPATAPQLARTGIGSPGSGLPRRSWH